MLVNGEIIEKLTAKQKIALLTDSLETVPELRSSDIPLLSVTELKSDTVDENSEIIFPSFSSLANSWDTQLFANVMQNQAKLRARDGANLFILPKTNAAQSVYGEEITEDPYLAGKLFSEAARCLKKAGASVCMQAPYASKSDIGVMDKTADDFVLNERMVRPFKMASASCGSVAVLRVQEEIEESYKIANQKMLESSLGKGATLITKLENGDNTVLTVNQGSQVLGGSSTAMETAYDNYKRIYRSMEEGGATAHELEMAILDGAAISDEIIDNALDKKISLTKLCEAGKFSKTSFATENLAEESVKKSIVLVKNSNALPLASGARVSLFGDIISSSQSNSYVNFVDKISSCLKNLGVDVVGYKKGYVLDEDVSEQEIAPACELASSSDVAIVFLGFGKEREGMLDKTQRLCLPANQIALVSEIAKLKKKVIAVLAASRLPSMGFDGMADSVLLVPPQGKAVADVLGKMLVGKIIPEGKLAYAAYNDMDTHFRRVQKRKNRGEQKIGQFIGYRYTDIVNTKAKYPFGHGLSYTRFNYYDITANSKSVTFTVQNSGALAGAEVAQIYVRCNNSSRQRPIKELKAIYKVYLEPKQQKRITVDLEELGIYDYESKEFVLEGGQYTVYVGASASDIRLSYTVDVIGKKLNASKQRISDYLHEVSNIRSESYTMEAQCKPMSNVSKLKTISSLLFILTIFSDIIYGVCGLLFDVPFDEQIGGFIALNLIALAIATVLRIVYHSIKSKAKKEQKEKEKKATAELFKNAQKINASSIEKLFADEFDQLEAEQTKKTVTYKGEAESIYVYMAVETDYCALCQEMEKHFKENGIIISPSLAKNVVASLMSSRLLVLRGKDEGVSKKFAQILSSFFGTETFMESQAGMNWEKDSLLYASRELGLKQRTLAQAIYHAQAEKQNAVFYAMTDVALKDTASFLMPYVQFLGNPLEEYTVTENGTSYQIPSSIWFVLIPSDGESIDSLPAFIANISSVIDLDVEEAEGAFGAISYLTKTVTPQQLEALKYRAKKATTIEEPIWKSVDALEEFINERVPYHIGNKIFLQIESYLSVYLSSGGVIGEAVDGMLSSKLLPAILSLTKGNQQMAEVDFIQTIASIFGEEYIERSSKLIKNPVMSKKESAPLAQVAAKEEKVEKTSEETDLAEKTEKTEKTVEGDAENAE